MRFTVGTLSFCAGSSHVHIPVTAGGQADEIVVNRADLAIDAETREEIRALFVQRIRTAVKEAGASTGAQLRSALEGKEFQTCCTVHRDGRVNVRVARSGVRAAA